MAYSTVWAQMQNRAKRPSHCTLRLHQVSWLHCVFCMHVLSFTSQQDCEVLSCSEVRAVLWVPWLGWIGMIYPETELKQINGAVVIGALPVFYT